jgi:formylglycine-generating enzyme required for sulfatase activity
MGNLWSESDTVGVFMVDEGGSIAANTLSGALNKPYRVRDFNVNKSELLPAADTIWFPASGKVNFVLYYPYKQTLTLDSIYSVDLSDQSRQEALDLMYAHNQTGYGADTKGSVEVVFEHQLTKLVFHVTKGSKITSLSGLSLELEDVALTTTFNLSSAKLTDGGIGGTDRLTPKIVSATTDEARAEAIVLPVKDLENKKIYLTITVDGSSYTATLPRPTNAATAALEAGYLYTYNVLLNKDGISLSGKLTPWNEGGTGTPQFREAPYPTSPMRIAMSSRIPAGTFLMGSPVTEPNRETNEAQHEVTLTQDFYMSRYEITNAQFATFLNATGVDDTGMGNVDGFGTNLLVEAKSQGVTWNGSSWEAATGRATYPVVFVTWYGAKAFADWTGMQLPTEAQWEYACRAGTTTAWYSGNDPAALDEYAWYLDNAAGVAHPIGGKKPNAWGLYDMHGNVIEWCADRYQADYLTLPTNIDPTGPISGTQHVLRGGSGESGIQASRSALRGYANPMARYANIGFRVLFVH